MLGGGRVVHSRPDSLWDALAHAGARGNLSPHVVTALLFLLLYFSAVRTVKANEDSQTSSSFVHSFSTSKSVVTKPKPKRIKP